MRFLRVRSPGNVADWLQGILDKYINDGTWPHGAMKTNPEECRVKLNEVSRDLADGLNLMLQVHDLLKEALCNYQVPPEQVKTAMGLIRLYLGTTGARR